VKKLEIGPGKFPIGGNWDVLDYVDGPNVDFVAKWGYEPLPFAEATWDYVYASHVLEHIPWNMAKGALQELFRILKPSGRLELHVPDFDIFIREYYLKKQGQPGWFPHYMQWLNCRTFGRDVRTYDAAAHHVAIYNREYLYWLLKQIGFVGMTEAPPPKGPEKHTGIDLAVLARKPI